VIFVTLWLILLEAFAPIAKLKQSIQIAVLLALFFSSRMTDPLHELIRGAKIIGGGGLVPPCAGEDKGRNRGTGGGL
jgi:nitrogen fixation/metabolism regulation signal transduction histidine kinase